MDLFGFGLVGTKQIQLIVEIFGHMIISKPSNLMQHHEPLEMTSNLANVYFHGKLKFQLGQIDLICLVSMFWAKSFGCQIYILSLYSEEYLSHWAKTMSKLVGTFFGKVTIWLSKVSHFTQKHIGTSIFPQLVKVIIVLIFYYYSIDQIKVKERWIDWIEELVPLNHPRVMINT